MGWNGRLLFGILSGTDLPYCRAYFACDNAGMYLKTHQRKKNGKINEYYSIVEKRKVAHGRYVQKTVLYLGEISDSQKKSWNKSIKVLNEQNQPVHKTLFALHDGDDLCENIDAIPLKLSEIKLEKPRTFGDCWLGCEIWDQLGLDEFWSGRIDTSKSPVAYSKVLKLLAVNRLIKPGAEFYVHHHWFDQTAMDFLLDGDFQIAEKNRLYRCLDRIMPHKDDLCRHLKQQWETMFKLQYDVLLYDLTSTYFEGLCKRNPKAKFGHSKDRRGDCRQVLVALVVTPEGFPINYEVLAGNTAEKTTLTDLMAKIEKMYGPARRVWLMDRGIPTEQSLAAMRESGIDYLVGTPRKLLDEFQDELIDKDWEQVNESVCVKYLEKEGECYVLARSKSRMAKERAIRKRKLRRYLAGLAKLQKNYRDRDRFMKRLGVLQHEAGSSRHCVDLQLPAEGKRVSKKNFNFTFNHQKYRTMIYRDGMYFLRTNQTDKEAVELWQQYMLQCNVEQAFKELKSDLGIRPVYHHKEERVEAHIFVAFLSYCLQATLRQKLRNNASGLTSQAVLETLSRIKLLNVSIPTQDGRTLRMQRYTEPEPEHELIFEKLQLTLPPQSPPKVYRNQVNN